MDQYTSEFVKTLFRSASASTSTWPYNSPHSDHGSRGGGEHLPPGHRHSHQRAPKRWEKDSLHSHKSVFLVIETFGGINCVSSTPPSFLCPQSGQGIQQPKQQSRSYWESFLCKVRAYFFLIIGLIYDFVAILSYIRPALHFLHNLTLLNGWSDCCNPLQQLLLADLHSSSQFFLLTWWAGGSCCDSASLAHMFWACPWITP